MRSDYILQVLTEDVMNSTLVYYPVHQRQGLAMENSKRYAAYFPSKASLAKFTVQEDDSTWEFSAPTYPPSRSSSATSCTSAGSTPAQEIAIRYRSGQALGLGERRSSSPESHSSGPGSSVGYEADSEYEPIAPDADSPPIRRVSRDEALFSTYQEALRMAKGRGPNNRVVCQRPGCRDTLPNVKALMYHLHIHEIHDRSVGCPHCKGRFDAQRELNMHDCAGRRRLLSPPTSPLRETFRRIVNKIIL